MSCVLAVCEKGKEAEAVADLERRGQQAKAIAVSEKRGELVLQICRSWEDSISKLERDENMEYKEKVVLTFVKTVMEKAEKRSRTKTLVLTDWDEMAVEYTREQEQE